MIAWMRRQSMLAQVLWLMLAIEFVRLSLTGEIVPAFWRGLTK